MPTNTNQTPIIIQAPSALHQGQQIIHTATGQPQLATVLQSGQCKIEE